MKKSLNVDSRKRNLNIDTATTGKHRAQEIDRETALQTSQNEETNVNRIPFTLNYHPQNLAIKNVILENFKILFNDSETKDIFSLPPLIPGTFACKRTRCKTCPFSDTVKISGTNRSDPLKSLTTPHASP